MLGKWNKSVILTYVGLSIAILGILLVLNQVDLKYAVICFIFAGVCDMFDGTVARRCKRTKEEKAFGIELDSLVDVVSFVALPLTILASINKNYYVLPIMLLYAIFAIARLAHFNITTENNNKPVPYYEGLAVTYTALVFPLLYLLFYFVKENTFIIIYDAVSLIVAFLFVLKIKFPKPKLLVSSLLLLLAIIVSIIYIFVL